MRAGNLGDVRSVGNGVLERRVWLGPGYRIYFTWDGPKLIILLGGGDKSDQRDDITRAQERWLDYQNRDGD
jgi:putative addiction module killer protein